MIKREWMRRNIAFSSTLIRLVGSEEKTTIVCIYIINIRSVNMVLYTSNRESLCSWNYTAVGSWTSDCCREYWHCGTFHNYPLYYHFTMFTFGDVIYGKLVNITKRQWSVELTKKHSCINKCVYFNELYIHFSDCNFLKLDFRSYHSTLITFERDRERKRKERISL
jgi:hypothetical protein